MNILVRGWRNPASTSLQFLTFPRRYRAMLEHAYQVAAPLLRSAFGQPTIATAAGLFVIESCKERKIRKCVPFDSE
jgi:hypothetical protein